MTKFPFKKFAVLLLLNLVFIFGCTHARAIEKPENKPWLAPNLKNSDRIKLKFNNFGIEVLNPNDENRVSNLHSIHNDQKIMRTLAFVTFAKNLDERLLASHEAIRKGGSIGITLAKNGFGLKKEIFYKGKILGLPDFITSKMDLNDPDDFATVVYDLNATVGDESLPYCTITEIYSPKYLTFADLLVIYGGHDDSSPASEVDEQLESQNGVRAKDNVDQLMVTLETMNAN